MGHFEVARDVFKHGGAFWIDAVGFQKVFIGRALGFWHVVGMHDVEDAVKQRCDAEAIHGAGSVGHRASGEHQFATGQSCNGFGEAGIRGHRSIVDVVHIIQETLGLQTVFLHQPAQRCAMLVVELLLVKLGVSKRHAQFAGDIFTNLHIDLVEQTA